MTRAKLTAYANSQGVRLDLADICNTVAEVDAAKEAEAVIQEYVDEYFCAKDLAPHNPTRHKKAFDKAMHAANSDNERDDILSEWRSVSPLESQVKDVKSMALNEVTTILIKAHIGKKRIKRMLPFLMETLQDEEYRSTKPPNVFALSIILKNLF